MAVPQFRPITRETIRIAMLGMVDGNGHPYSWSAIFNGYDPEAMADCPYPSIPAYLGREPKESLRIPGARVTHIWTDDPADAASTLSGAVPSSRPGSPYSSTSPSPTM